MVLGFIISMSAIAAGTYAIHLGKDLVGLAALVGALTTLVVPFVLRKKYSAGKNAEPTAEPESPKKLSRGE